MKNQEILFQFLLSLAQQFISVLPLIAQSQKSGVDNTNAEVDSVRKLYYENKEKLQTEIDAKKET